MSFTPSPLSARALIERQLADWQQFKADLTLRDASADELAYAQTQIERLAADLWDLVKDSGTQNGNAQ